MNLSKYQIEGMVSHFETAFYMYSKEINPILSAAHGNTDYSEKSGPGDLVTEYDVLAEQIALRHFQHTPSLRGVGFLGEEIGSHGQQETYISVDGIDGTSSFVKGLPGCATQCAFIHNGKVLAAGVSDFVSGDIYASRDHDFVVRGDRFSAVWKNMKDPASISRNPNSVIKLYGAEGSKKDKLITALQDQDYEVQEYGSASHIAINMVEGNISAYISLDNPLHQVWDFAPVISMSRAIGAGGFELGQDSSVDIYGLDVSQRSFWIANPANHNRSRILEAFLVAGVV